MNRAVVKFFTSSSRMIPRIYASTKTSGTTPAAAAATAHHGSAEVHHHDHGHGHGHDHHHHEPDLRKTHEWRHQSGIQSKYENQGEDPSITFMQERPNYHDYRPSLGQVALSIPYRTQAHLYEMWFYHVALVLSIWFWWYVSWRFLKEPSWFFGHAHFPDMSKFTDEELGIPSDDLD
ncbi:unnamed protein product [Adineta steineri]|uniref:Uncharacterized protein n=1 Tax=Adineta steineri TaxID=433720 RepID=A0A814JKP5_9BILA|nr:unnamed protein product [Adineta steineri]CAF1097883.1 unnamed protein product [Adineta steineri]CAF3797942.1 unnamed protein product [Adineta steineri]CAF3998969.1 unnamed protein product [Adineta steineri]